MLRSGNATLTYLLLTDLFRLLLESMERVDFPDDTQVLYETKKMQAPLYFYVYYKGVFIRIFEKGFGLKIDMNFWEVDFSFYIILYSKCGLFSIRFNM